MFNSLMLNKSRVALPRLIVAHRLFEEGGTHTIGFSARWSSALSNGAVSLKVDVPALLLASLVLQGESEDGSCLLDGILLLSWLSVHSLADGVKGLGGREFGVCETHFERVVCLVGGVGV